MSEAYTKHQLIGDVPENWNYFTTMADAVVYKEGENLIILYNYSTDEVGEKTVRNYKRLKPIK